MSDPGATSDVEVALDACCLAVIVVQPDVARLMFMSDPEVGA
jgi:hypothetical protein